MYSQSSKQIGIEHFGAHDLRRTLLYPDLDGYADDPQKQSISITICNLAEFAEIGAN